MTRKSSEGRSFERGLEELESIVTRLEQGEATLEESLELFERGTAQLKELTAMLEEAERKVEVLTRARDGSLEGKPFEEEESD